MWWSHRPQWTNSAPVPVAWLVGNVARPVNFVTIEVVVEYSGFSQLEWLWPLCPHFTQADANPQTPGNGPPTKLDQVQGQVNEVKVILKDNISKVLERGDRLDDLINKTDDLQASVSAWWQWTTPDLISVLHQSNKTNILYFLWFCYRLRKTLFHYLRMVLDLPTR